MKLSSTLRIDDEVSNLDLGEVNRSLYLAHTISYGCRDARLVRQLHVAALGVDPEISRASVQRHRKL